MIGLFQQLNPPLSIIIKIKKKKEKEILKEEKVFTNFSFLLNIFMHL